MRGPGAMFRGRGDRDYGQQRRNHRRDDNDSDDERLERAWDAEEDYDRKAGRFYQGDGGDDGLHREAIVETVYRKPREYADLHEYDDIPVIDRVPTAVGFRSQDSADLLNEEKSRASRYGLDEVDDPTPSPTREEKKIEMRKSKSIEDYDDKYSNDIAKASASVWSDSTDSHAPMWRSYSDDEANYMNRAQQRPPAPKRDDRALGDERVVGSGSLERAGVKSDQTDAGYTRESRDPDGYRDAVDEKRRSEQKLRDVLSKRPGNESGRDDNSDRSDSRKERNQDKKGQTNNDNTEQNERKAKKTHESVDEPTLSMSRSDHDEDLDISKKKSHSLSMSKSDNSDDIKISKKKSRSKDDSTKDGSRDEDSEESSKGRKKSTTSKRKEGENRFKSKRSATRKLAMLFRGPGSRGSRASNDKNKKKGGKKEVSNKSTPKKRKPDQNGKASAGKRAIVSKNSSTSSSGKSSKKPDPSLLGESEDKDRVDIEGGKQSKEGDDDDTSDSKDKVVPNRPEGRGSSYDSYEERKRRKQRATRSQNDDDKLSAKSSDKSSEIEEDTSKFDGKGSTAADSVLSDAETKDSSLPAKLSQRPGGLPDVSRMHLEDESDWGTVDKSTVHGDKKVMEEPLIVTNLRNSNCGVIATCVMAGVYTLDGIENLGHRGKQAIMEWGTTPGQLESSTQKSGMDGEVSGSLNLDGLEEERTREISSRTRDHTGEQDPSSEAMERNRSREKGKDRSRRSEMPYQDKRSDDKKSRDEDKNHGDARHREDEKEDGRGGRMPRDYEGKNKIEGDGVQSREETRRKSKRDDEYRRDRESERYEEHPQGRKGGRDGADDRQYGRKNKDGKRDESESHKRQHLEDSRGRKDYRKGRNSENPSDKDLLRNNEQDSPDHEGRRGTRREGRELHSSGREEEAMRSGTPTEVRSLQLDKDDAENYSPNAEKPKGIPNEEKPKENENPEKEPQMSLPIPSDCISVTSIEIPLLPSLMSNQCDDEMSILGLAKPNTQKAVRPYQSETAAVPQVQLKKGKPSFIGKFLARKKRQTGE